MKNSFWRDAGLLAIGAIISLATSVISDWMHNRAEDQRNNVSKKLELNHDISKDLGDRYYITCELMKARQTKDSPNIRRWHEEFSQCQEQWNQNIYSYQSLLRNYYDSSLEDNFVRAIYNPLVELGNEAVDTNLRVLKDPTFFSKANSLRIRTVIFVSSIYNLADKKSVRQ